MEGIVANGDVVAAAAAAAAVVAAAAAAAIAKILVADRLCS